MPAKRIRPLEPDPLHLVLRAPFFGPIIELGRARALVPGHCLRVFKRSAIAEMLSRIKGSQDQTEISGRPYIGMTQIADRPGIYTTTLYRYILPREAGSTHPFSHLGFPGITGQSYAIVGEREPSKGRDASRPAG
jgi:hypothetical protein